ncbi:MAG: hypothetical protein AB7T22_12435 [Calditrichaceae bacterium]
MDLNTVLKSEKRIILESAINMMNRVRLTHYEKSPAETTSVRIETLYEVMNECVLSKQIIPMLSYTEKIANERHAEGFDLYEVHSAFNILEETIWKEIVKQVPPDELAVALGTVSTVLGAGKEHFAQTYVSLAANKKAPSLNLRALFDGAE